MEKNVNLKHYLGQKINVNVIKATHRRSNFSKKLVMYIINIFKHRFKKKSALKIPEFWVLKMLLAFL